MSAAAIEARHLSFAYPGAPPLFGGIDLAVRDREVVALLGGSGCGKSTLLRVLAGLLPPRAGSVHLAGQSVTAPHPRASLLFQQPSLLPWLRVHANVAFGLDFEHQPRLPRAEQQRRVQAALAAVGLLDAKQLWPAQLSGGMAQRVALARALAREPVMLFADEPFSALDAITRAEMQALLLDVVRRFDTAVLLVTHDIDEALAVADRVLLMGPGERQVHRLLEQWVLPPASDLDGRQRLRAEIRSALVSALRGAAAPA
jgi:NitT/TauT family transport system ATP-binding protein